MSKIPASVLAFEKKLVPSDALMYGTTWEDRQTKAVKLKLQEKSVRGTISNRLKASIANDSLKLDAEVQKANLQTVDSCALSSDQDTLKVSFTLKVLSGVEQPSACNHEGFNQSYTQAVRSYIETHSFQTLATRYAINLANGRFLWRNRVGCESVEVHIETTHDDSFNEIFNATDYEDFSAADDKIQRLSQLIAQTLSGQSEFILLRVSAFAKIGEGQDVYPSEELVLDKGTNTKGAKSKILFDVNEVAAMHSQKIGNAIRCVDTWYPDYDERLQPIAADPYGAVTNLGRAFRNPKSKNDFFTLFDKFAQGENIAEDDQHFVMAVLVRGGVFGESSK